MSWSAVHACLLAALLAAAAGAEPPGGRYGLPELAAEAVSRSRLLGSQESRVEEARLSAAQARAWPGATAGFSFGRKSEEGSGGPRYEAGLSQPLLVTGASGLRGSLLDVEAQAWRVQRAASGLDVALEAVELAYEYALGRRRADFVDRRRKRFELVQEYLAGRVFPTPQRKAESRIVAGHVQGLASDAVEARAGFKASFERLRALVPLAPGSYPDIDVPWFSGGAAIDEAAWLAKALENNPGLRLRRLAAAGADLGARLAEREGLPEPALTASYEQGRAAGLERSFGLGLSVALPPWNRNRSGVGSARSRRLAEERLLAHEEARLKAEVPRLAVECAAAAELVRSYPQSVLAELDSQLAEAGEGFGRGQVDLLTFLELDDAAAETFERALRAQRQLAAGLARLMAAAGEQDAVLLLGSY